MTHPAFTQATDNLTVNRLKEIKRTKTGDDRDCALFFLLSDYAEFVGVPEPYIVMVSSLRHESQKHRKCLSILRGFVARQACDGRVLEACA